ncbi:MAG: hypothetical protein BWY32_03590 [bacterium ADurb.Bin243]|mgnify:CR=1 FL=1|nr:MAG: hypothetical protein BWY32_03590 [bacterium ADurb.Bin243]
MKELISVSSQEELERGGIPFKRYTILRWHSTGKYPEIFAKIGGKVFINKEAWTKLVTGLTGNAK